MRFGRAFRVRVQIFLLGSRISRVLMLYVGALYGVCNPKELLSEIGGVRTSIFGRPRRLSRHRRGRPTPRSYALSWEEPHTVDPHGLLGAALAEASPDPLRTLLQRIVAGSSPRTLTRSPARNMAGPVLTGLPSATATATASSTPASARSTSPSPSSANALNPH